MCFSQEISGFFSALSVAAAYWGYRKQGARSACGCLYFGAMELLQFFQYFVVARPEDGYAQCGNQTNQFLTGLGLLHICFQPYFALWVRGGIHRPHDLRKRYEYDLLEKLTLLGGCWIFARHLFAIFHPNNPDLRARPTVDCPNYEWLSDGYDPWLQHDPPNWPGHSCTYIPPSATEHLAWATPLYQATYFSPGTSVHFFLMFAPAFLMDPTRPWKVIFGVLSGPGLAVFLTASLNEQAAIWCYFSVCQLVLWYVLTPTLKGCEYFAKRIVYEGKWGEPTMEYELVEATTANKSNGHSSNGHVKKLE